MRKGVCVRTCVCALGLLFLTRRGGGAFVALNYVPLAKKAHRSRTIWSEWRTSGRTRSSAIHCHFVPVFSPPSHPATVRPVSIPSRLASPDCSLLEKALPFSAMCSSFLSTGIHCTATFPRTTVPLRLKKLRERSVGGFRCMILCVG